jgi:hypothetical protein
MDVFIERARAVINGKDPRDHIFIAIALEDEIERRGIQSEYVFALAVSLFGEQDEWGTAHIMKMMRATPEQRARAFLEAVKA